MRVRNRDMVIERLGALDPIAGEAPDQLWDSRAEEMLAAILSSAHEDPASRALRRTSTGRARRLRVVAATLVVVGIAAVTLLIGLPGSRGGDGAAALLDRVARAAAAQPPATAADAAYLYLKTRAFSVDTAVADRQTWSTYRSETREEWVAPDGSGRLRVRSEPPQFVGPADRAAWEAAGRPNFAAGTGTVDRTVPAGHFEVEVAGREVSSLPTEPGELSTLIRRQAEAEAARSPGSSVPLAARSLDVIAEVLRDPTAGPRLRAALYRAASEVPGIEDLGEATDRVGRGGVAVGVTSDYSGGPETYSLIFDPASAEVLATETTASEPRGFADAEGPLVTSATVYLESRGAGSSSGRH